MKMKKALALSLLALGAVGVSACGKEEKSPEEVAAELAANKKTVGKQEVDSYVNGLLSGANLEAYTSLNDVVAAEKAKIDAKDSEAAIETAIADAKTAILAEFNNTKDVRIAIRDAKTELNSTIAIKKVVAGFDANSTAFDTIKNEVIAKIDAATTKSAIAKIMVEANAAILDICGNKAATDLAATVATAKTTVSGYATEQLTAKGVTDTDEVVSKIVADYEKSFDKASFEKEVALIVNAAKIDIDFAVANLVNVSLAPNREAAITAYDEYVPTALGDKTDDGSVAAKVLELKAKLPSYVTAEEITAAVEAGKLEIKEVADAIMTAEQVTAFKEAKKTALVAYATSLGYTNAIDGYEANMAAMNTLIDNASSKLDAELAYNDARKMIYDGTEDYLEQQESKVYIDIATVEDFLKMQDDLVAAESMEDPTEKDKVLSRNYRLTASIDMSGVKATEGSNIQNFKGTFDGNGFAIKNYNITNAAQNKRGLLFRSTAEGAVIKNVIFFNCSHTGEQEGIALIVGDATNTTFKNLEFNGCTVDAGSKSYAGLLIGRNTRKGVTVEGISVKSSYCSANYGGGLIGDARDLGNTAKVVFKNLNIDMTMNVVGNTGGLLMGRTDTDTFAATVENAIINVNITGNSTKASALFDGSSTGSTHTYKNVIISGATRDKVTSDIVAGAGKLTPTMTNVYVVSDATEAKYDKYTDVKTVTKAELTEEFLMTTIGLGDAWVMEDGKAKLQFASTGVIPADATVQSLSINYQLAKTRYKIGEAFDSNGITVTATYLLSNGVTMDRTLESYEYTVSCANFNNKVAGTYKATVTFGSESETYDVSVVEIESIQVVTNEATQIFTDIKDFTTEGLVIRTVYSDGKVEKLDDANYEYDLVNVGAGNGTYSVSILTGENGNVFTGSYDISIVGQVDFDATSKKLEVYVDSLARTSTVEDGVAVFATVKDALDYIEALNLDGSVEKIVKIAAGNYEEKVVVNDDNVTFVGETDSNGNAASIIEFGMANGHDTFDLSGTWGTDKSASVLIYGTSFAATNVAFVNSFDYFNDKTAGSGTQALAIGVYADQAVFNNCFFTGYQDTIQVKNGRTYFYDCTIEGCVDYIFGVNCTAYFKECDIVSLDRKPSNTNNGYVVAPKTDEAYTYGFYFDTCNFTAEETVKDGSMALARPWGAKGTCVIFNSTISKAYSKAAYGTKDTQPRYADMSGNKPGNANFKEFGNTGDGAIATAVEGVKIMEATELLNYTITKLFAAGEGTGVTYTAWDAQADMNAIK